MSIYDNYEPSEGRRVHTCEYCDEDICEGEEYYEYEGDYYHEECFCENAVEILENYGATKKTAVSSEECGDIDLEYDLMKDEQKYDEYY